MPSGTLVSASLQLRQLLGREEEACRSLLDTVQEERAAIRTLAITEFHAINRRRLAILESLQVLAQERDRLVKHLAQCYELAQTTTTHALLDRLTGPESDGLQAQYKSFMVIAKTVRAEIQHNVVLIEGIRGVVDKALSAGSNILPGLDLYQHDGRTSAVPAGNALIHQQG